MVKKDRWAETQPIDCVASTTRVGKGCSFGGSRSSRGLLPKEPPIPRASMSRNPTRSVPVEEAAASHPFTSPVDRFGRPSTMLPPPPAGGPLLYGRERPKDLIGAQELAASNPMAVLWSAGMGQAAKPRPFSREELARRRSKQPIRIPLKTSSNLHYPTGPVLVVDEELAASGPGPHFGKRPSSTSSFCAGQVTVNA